MKNLNLTPNAKSILGRQGISAVVLFGSQALGTMRESSDFDFGILVNKVRILNNYKSRLKIYDALYDLFSNLIGELKDIDIIFLQTAPAELQMHAVKKGKLLYEQKPGIFANFKAKIMIEYADFAPLREIFHTGILSRIK